MKFLAKQITALTLASGLLMGCATSLDPTNPGLVLAPNVTKSLTDLGNFTMQDLKNADAIAVKANDQIGHQCFVGLELFVAAQQASLGGAAGNTVSGAVSAFEAARTSLIAGNQLISKQDLNALEIACGPLDVDTRNNAAAFLAGLAALGIK